MIFFYVQETGCSALVFLLVSQVHAVRYLQLFLSNFSFQHSPVVEIAKVLCPNKALRELVENINPNISSYPSLAPPPCTPTAGCLAVKSLPAPTSASPRGCSAQETPIPPQPPALPRAVFLSPHCSALLFPCRLTGNEPLTILPLTSEMEEAAVKAHYKVCDRLKLEKKQRRMCRRDPGVAETLMEAISMSALECQYQFRFERWNCTLEGRYRASLLKRGERGGILCWGVLASPAPISCPWHFAERSSWSILCQWWVTTSPEVQKRACRR